MYSQICNLVALSYKYQILNKYIKQIKNLLNMISHVQIIVQKFGSQ